MAPAMGGYRACSEKFPNRGEAGKEMNQESATADAM